MGNDIPALFTRMSIPPADCCRNMFAQKKVEITVKQSSSGMLCLKHKNIFQNHNPVPSHQILLRCSHANHRQILGQQCPADEKAPVFHPGPNFSSSASCQESKVHPGKLMWDMKITQWKRKVIFLTSILGFHVDFPGCKCKSNVKRNL